jgi:hypothetical protein
MRSRVPKPVFVGWRPVNPAPKWPGPHTTLPMVVPRQRGRSDLGCTRVRKRRMTTGIPPHPMGERAREKVVRTRSDLCAPYSGLESPVRARPKRGSPQHSPDAGGQREWHGASGGVKRARRSSREEGSQGPILRWTTWSTSDEERPESSRGTPTLSGLMRCLMRMPSRTCNAGRQTRDGLSTHHCSWGASRNPPPKMQDCGIAGFRDCGIAGLRAWGLAGL